MTFSLMTYNQKMLSPEQEAEMIAEWIETKDNKVLVKIIRAFSPLVAKYARKYALYGIAKEELTSVGNLALVETAHRFDPSRGFKFSTYASHWIKGTMLIFIASNYFAFSLKSQKMKHIFFSLRRILYTEQNQKVVDLNDIMDRMAGDFGVSRTKLDEIYTLIRQPNTSFDEPINSRPGADSPGEQVTFGDLLLSNEPDPETALMDVRLDKFRKDLVYKTMTEVLKDRERTIIMGQMMMEEGQEKTLQDLADEFNLSRERIRQIRNTAYQKLVTAIHDKCRGIEPQAIF